MPNNLSLSPNKIHIWMNVLHGGLGIMLLDVILIATFEHEAFYPTLAPQCELY